MASIVVNGDTSGSVTLSAPAVAGTTTLTLPATSGTILTTASSTGISGSAISSGTVAEAYGGTGTNTGYYGFKNRIINGAMVIDQRNAGASVTNTAGATTYTLDRWALYGDQASKFTVQQSSTSTTGFINSLLVTSSSSYSVGASEIFNIQQRIEGLNCADLAWGTANAATVTMSFWVRSSLTGTFGGSIMNSAENRNYPFIYTISAANTWEQKSVTIAGDTSGTWLTTNGTGIRIFFSIGTGSSVSGTAGAWAAGAKYSATGATSVVGTNGATFYLTGVQLEKGSTATSFDYRPYTTELSLCQRYYYKTKATGAATYFGAAYHYSGTQTLGFVKFAVTMRTTPTALEQTGTASDYNVLLAGGSTTCTSVPTFDGAGVEGASAQFNVSGVTSGQGSMIRGLNSNAYLAWSAEL